MKKLIPAICMTLIAAFMLASSTFAWFSMNRTVTATGMEVTAKSNAQYLLIGIEDTATEIQAKNPAQTTVAAKHATVGNDAKKVYPCAFTTTELDSGTIPANKWYTASSNSTSDGMSGVHNYKLVTEGDKDYMLTYTFNMTLTKDSEQYTGKLNFTFASTSGDNAVSMCVVVGTEHLLLGTGATTAQTAGDHTITGDDVLTVTVYIYINGTSTNVNTDYVNTNTLTGIVTVQVDLEAVGA